jgi:CDP-diacylglycerol pyrophosphatase
MRNVAVIVLIAAVIILIAGPIVAWWVTRDKNRK